MQKAENSFFRSEHYIPLLSGWISIRKIFPVASLIWSNNNNNNCLYFHNLEEKSRHTPGKNLENVVFFFLKMREIEQFLYWYKGIFDLILCLPVWIVLSILYWHDQSSLPHQQRNIFKSINKKIFQSQNLNSLENLYAFQYRLPFIQLIFPFKSWQQRNVFSKDLKALYNILNLQRARRQEYIWMQ